MITTFNCASCSAPLEFAGQTTQKCQFCGSTVITPPAMFATVGSSPFADISALTGKALQIAEIDKLIHEGQKIEAIKRFRETFGVGLKEAKDAVEAMERGESVDISGMQVRSSRAQSAATAKAVKTAGYAIGGSVLASVLIPAILIIGVTGVILFVAFNAISTESADGEASNSKAAPIVSERKAEATTAPASETMKIGGEGNSPGRFQDNRHVAVGSDGRIYSSDYSPHKIQVFDAAGKFLNQWEPASGQNLYGLGADRSGNVFIANNKGIFKHEGTSGKLLQKIENLNVDAMAVTWDGKVVASIRGSIITYDNDLKVISEIKDAAGMVDASFGFNQLAVGGDGTIFAVPDHKSDICKFSKDGKFLDRIPGKVRSPNGIAVDPKGRLFVSDTNTIVVLDENGGQVGAIPAKQAFGLIFDLEGNLYVATRPFVTKYAVNF